MSRENCDLFSIVHNPKDATFTAPKTNTKFQPNTITNNISPLDTTTHFPISQENDSFSFSNVMQPRTNGYLGLQQMLMNFMNPSNTIATTITTTSGNAINPNPNPNSAFSKLTGFSGQQKMQQGLHRLVPVLTTCTSIGTSTDGLNIFNQQQHQPQLHQQQPQVPQTSSMALPVHEPQKSSTALPNIQPHVPETSSVALQSTEAQAPRIKRRKTEQKIRVCHMTADNITTDMWAWRKYGRKTIKGSPHPRNYYRCNSTNACAARKLVERSTTEPSMFIVTYIGDHDHEKPFYETTFFGFTRLKPSTTHLPNTSQFRSPSDDGSASLSSSSPLLVSDLLENRNNTVANGENQVPDPVIEPESVSDADDDILIPNLAAMSEIFEMGYQCFDGSAKYVGGSDPNSMPSFI